MEILLVERIIDTYLFKVLIQQNVISTQQIKFQSSVMHLKNSNTKLKLNVSLSNHSFYTECSSMTKVFFRKSQYVHSIHKMQKPNP